MKKRVLFLVPARLGDALMITPALALLKRFQPGFSIDILAFSPLGGEVYLHNPHCDNVYIASEIQLASSFVNEYDFWIAAHRDYKILELTEQFRKPLLLIEPADEQQSQAQQALNFIECVFSDTHQKREAMDYQLFPSAKDMEYASQLLNPEKIYIGLHLGCHSINKKRGFMSWRKVKQHKKLWPLKAFIQLARQLKHQHSEYQLVLTGGGNEQHLADEFMMHISDVVNLVGRTNVLQLAAVMQHFSAYICSDSGPMHVACAMQIPIVSIFGPTNVKHTGPYPRTGFRRVIQTENLSKLQPESVLTVINQLLERPPECDLITSE